METENKNVTTEDAPNVESTDRSLGTLLKLDTYNDLTDGEVRALINHFVEIAHSDETLTVLRNNAQNMAEEHSVVMATIVETTENVLQSIIDSKPNYKGVELASVANLLETYTEV